MTRSDVAQGPSRVLPGPRRAHRARDRRATTSTSSATRPTRSRTRRRPAPRSGSRWASGSTRSCAASARAARSPASAATSRASRRTSRWCSPIPRARCSPTTSTTGHARHGRLVARRGDRRGLRAADLRSLARARAPTRSPTTRASPPRARCCGDEGILAGSSSGTLVAAALRYCREQTTPKRVVTFVCDSGNKYLSKMFNDYWMRDQGFLRGRSSAICATSSRAAPRRARSIAVAPDDTLAHRARADEALRRLAAPGARGRKDRRHPRRVGSAARGRHATKTRSATPVRDFMTGHLETVQTNAPLESLFELFRNGLVAIVCDGEQVSRPHHADGRGELLAEAVAVGAWHLGIVGEVQGVDAGASTHHARSVDARSGLAHARIREALHRRVAARDRVVRGERATVAPAAVVGGDVAVGVARAGAGRVRVAVGLRRGRR